SYANCSYNGKAYPPGAKVGPSTCMPNGTWQPQIQQSQPHVQQPQQPQPHVQQPQQPQPHVQQSQAQQPQPHVQQPQGQHLQGQPPRPQILPTQQKLLTPVEARQHIQDLNRNRTALSGINRHPLPLGQVTVHADGKHSIATSEGRHIDVRPNG